ncbi:uncharacterized protein [Aegilops tauschii subsp. strangulata]|uniref:RING-type domain-containing protein n=1 Tax=Aegilops tauschii subsp. strangulata TaxID=200361 RepID=A0A453EC17_AEGTS
MPSAVFDIEALDEEGWERIHRYLTGNKDTARDQATETAMKALKTVEAPSDGRDCPICLDNAAARGAWKEGPCGHSFHEACLEKWLIKDKDKGSCPLCRRKLAPRVFPPLSDIARRNGRHVLGVDPFAW